MAGPCRVRRGFFVLRDCGAASVATCGDCRRAHCEDHGTGAANRCVECAARAKEGVPDDPSDPAWAASFRGRYYRGAHYNPIYFASGDGGSTFDDYDARSFDAPEGSAAADFGDDGDGRGLDS